MGGVLTTLFLSLLICFASCDNGSISGGNSEDSQSDQNNQFDINYSLGDAPQSNPLQEGQDYNKIDVDEGIYIKFDIPTTEKYWTTRVYIKGLGPVAEEVQYTDQNKTKGCFYYPFVEAGKEYTIRFVFLRDEDRDKEGFVINYQGDDGSIGWFETKVTAGAQSKGEVRFTSKGKIDVKKNGDFRFTEKPTFQNEYLLDGKWEAEIGLVEGVSWAHGAERRTNWHSMQETIPSYKLTESINLYKDQKNEKNENKYSIDFICVRPILYYEHDGKKYKYQWDSFAQDIYYPPRNPDGIYLELDFPKNEFSRCDVNIDGIGKIAEEVKPLDENETKGCFFYPFLEADKEYTIRFSFKKPEPVDSAGFTLPTPGDDTLTEVTKKATAGPRAKGEVRLPWEKIGYLKADSECNIVDFQKPTFENEQRLGNAWMIEIGLMEGISWNHPERRTKWHCAVVIPKDFDANSKNLRNLKEMSPGYEPCDHEHDIDCICVRPIMLYEYGGKTYKYQWDGNAFDVHYPLNAQEININNPADIAKIIGTWKYSENWYDDNYYINEDYCIPVKVKCTKTLIINNKNHEIEIIEIFTKKDEEAFTDKEKVYWNVGINNDFNNQKYSVTISSDNKTITRNNNWQGEEALLNYFADFNDEYNNYTKYHTFKLLSDIGELWDLAYGTDNGRYYEWPDVYKKQ